MKTLYVISDVHLGGEEGFQMFTGQATLACFLEWIRSQAAADPAHGRELIIAGDGIDFLAEREIKAFTASDEEARRKLETLMDRTANRPVFDGLAALVQQGVGLTIMLGNHDTELALPGCQRLIRQRLGEVELILDGEPCRRGPVHIEHGNQIDPWNCVDHALLAELGEQLEQGDSRWGDADSSAMREALRVAPGSQLVVDVMNQIKKEYGFVDLLKPERESVLPLLIVLRPDLSKDLTRLLKLTNRIGIRLALRSLGIKVGMARGEIAAETTATRDQERALYQELERRQKESRQLVAQLSVHAPDDHTELIRAADWIPSLYNIVRACLSDPDDKRYQLRRLCRALRTHASAHLKAFRITEEDDLYLDKARHHLEQGAQVVILGHTHCAKSKPIGVFGYYLNTGAWADLMTFPEEVMLADEEAAIDRLEAFVTDLMANDIERWRTRVPTIAQVELDEQQEVVSKDVYIFVGEGDRKPGATPLSTEELRACLTRKHRTSSESSEQPV